jgi:hypothetical protein
VTQKPEFIPVLQENLGACKKLFSRLGRFEGSLHYIKEVSWLCLNMCCFNPETVETTSPPVDISHYFNCELEIVEQTTQALQVIKNDVTELIRQLQASESALITPADLQKTQRIGEYQKLVENLLWMLSNIGLESRTVLDHMFS